VNLNTVLINIYVIFITYCGLHTKVNQRDTPADCRPSVLSHATLNTVRKQSWRCVIHETRGKCVITVMIWGQPNTVGQEKY
jgi:hypothetical protein